MTEDKGKSWNSIGCKLSKNTLNALKGLNFEKPTPIQIHVIPTFLKKKDVVAQAVTGSGKTLSFIIPIIELLNKVESFNSSNIFSIILSPTTELAQQIFDMFNDFLSNFNGSKPNLKLFSKQSISTQFDSNKGIVLISTPGVFAKSLEEGDGKDELIRSLKALEVLILDEADRLLEMGFESQLLTILKSLPKQRITGLFSATQTTEVDDLTRAGLRNPVRVSVKVKQDVESEYNDNIPKNLDNNYMLVNKENKLDILIQFLREHKDKKVLVFFATCHCVDYFHRILSLILNKHNFLALHRKLKNKRIKIFQKFKQMKNGVMLCTDVMARGIDIPNIDWVIQYDPPKSAANFVHRCGRTGRLDRYGQTLILLRQNEDTYVHFLRENQNVNIDEYKPNFDPNLVENNEKRVRDLCIADRLLYEKSIRAFVSYIMSYRKHDLKYLFKLSNINMGQLGNSFGLLRMPQMTELKSLDLSDFNRPDVDLTKLEYKDKSVRIIRNKTRLIKKERNEREAMEVDEVEDESNEEDNENKMEVEETEIKVKKSDKFKKKKTKINTNKKEMKDEIKKKTNDKVTVGKEKSKKRKSDTVVEEKPKAKKFKIVNNGNVKNNSEKKTVDKKPAPKETVAKDKKEKVITERKSELKGLLFGCK